MSPNIVIHLQNIPARLKGRHCIYPAFPAEFVDPFRKKKKIQNGLMCTKSLSDAIYHTVRLNKQAGRKPSTKYVLISFFFFFKPRSGGFVFSILQYPSAGTRKREVTVVRRGNPCLGFTRLQKPADRERPPGSGGRNEGWFFSAVVRKAFSPKPTLFLKKNAVCAGI